LIFVKQWYIGNIDSGAGKAADSTENALSYCHVRKTYHIYESRNIPNRHGNPRLSAFGIQRDIPVVKGHQDWVHFYFASKDSYDTSEMITLKYTVCGLEILTLNDPVRAIFLYSRNGTNEYEHRTEHLLWFNVDFSAMD
jgi:hypothetical protein